MTGLARTSARVLAVSALAVGTVPFGGSVHAGGIRTDTTLAGFSVKVEASPLRILLDDPKLAIPRDPGAAVLEADPNYSLAGVSAGPNAIAIGSSLWPGNLLGEGLPALTGGPGYPIKAEARYPDKPYTTTGPDGGVATSASAMGLDALGKADGAPTNKPGEVTVGAVTSTSSATVDAKNVAVGKAISAVKNVDLLGGLIHIGSVATTLTTTADGKKPTSSGTTTVTGLTIGPAAFTVDDKGLHAAGQGSALPAVAPAALGISAKLVNQSSTKPPNGAGRVAGGLIITVDTGPLRATASPVTNPLAAALNDFVDTYVPPDQQGNFYYLIKATPQITFVFGSAKAMSAATLPFTFDPPSFDPPSFPGLGGVAPGGPAIVPGGTAVPPGIGSVPPGGAAVVPQFADQGGAAATPPGFQPPTVAASSSSKSGIGAGPILGALAVSGLVGWLLTRFLGLAGGALGIGCRLGAPTSVPNLRSVTA